MIYNHIKRSKKTRIEYHRDYNDWYDHSYYWGSQWVLLTREIAEIFVNLTKEDYSYVRKTFKEIDASCPDEIYPMLILQRYFGPPSSKDFKKRIKNQIVTKTIWKSEYSTSHPLTFTTRNVEGYRKEICSSEALFARKFTKKSAKKLGMDC